MFRTYQWGDDGLFGWSDNQARLCMGLALWNGRDKILKERLFGLTGTQVCQSCLVNGDFDTVINYDEISVNIYNY